ncbi:alpha/beta hydrolase [Solirubrobacter ginsenosidimutans]|uniref:Alpha/beta hydrolase n=1 Tax=Solirubrobacter ginsenosidimutans TaxID=490573 RepID=A0A9X3MNH0_9ACTN|nr:alpha/beta hydrolase [Solirubrobacter ginsenosidimutans]MDA0158977.1 alpha/beta hydrolase [Solirubrobacter ginsenosidimutans]
MIGSQEPGIREAEAELFAATGAQVEELWFDLPTLGLRVRVLAHGSGLPVVLLHGVSLSAAVWAPLLTALGGCRLLAVDLPGHGLSDPFEYRRGQVREHAHQLLEDLFDALELERATVIGHSLGGMFALWHAARSPERMSSLIAIGDPAVALPGTRVRMPLSLLTVRGVGRAILSSPSPRPFYRHLLTHGLGHAEVASAPLALLEALRLSGRRSGNARTIASLMHAIDRFRVPRPESVLTSAELAAIATPTMFIWGTDDPYLSPARARPAIRQMPNATLHALPAGHGPWLVHPSRTAELIHTHLSRTASQPR